MSTELRIDPKDVARAQLAHRHLERRRMQDDFYFVENYVWIENKLDTAAEPKILFKLWSEQKDAWESIDKHQKNIILKARQLGITWLIISLILKRSLDIKGHTSLWMSQTLPYVKEAFDRFEFILQNLPSWFMQELKTKKHENNLLVKDIYLYEKTATKVVIWHPIPDVVGEIRQKSEIKGVASTPGAGRSVTADIVAFDEWAFHENAQKVWQAAFPTINREGAGKFIGLSTNERGSLFEQVVLERVERKFNLVFLSVWVDPSRTEEWYKDTVNALPDSYMQEYPRTVEEALSAGKRTAFPEFSRSIHVCKTFKPPEHWARWASVDNGYNDPYAWYKYAINEDGIVFVYYEQSRDRDKDPKVYYDDQAVEFMDSCWINNPDYEDAYEVVDSKYMREPIRYMVAGRDAWNTHHRDESGKTLIDYYREGVTDVNGEHKDGVTYPFVLPVTDRKAGVVTLHHYLKPFKTMIVDKHGNKKEIWTAKLQIMDCCPHLIRTIPQLVKDKNEQEKVEDNSDIDNPYDSLRYGLISWHKKKSEIPKEKEKPHEVYKKRVTSLHKTRRRGIVN